MTTNPIVTSRPSAVGFSSPRTGTTRPPFKSILRETSTRATDIDHSALKRKRGSDDDISHDADKRRRLLEGDDTNGMGRGDRFAETTGEAEDDENDDSAVDLATTTKRQKTVHFDMSLTITTEVGRRTLDATKTAVRRALENHAIAVSHPGHDDQDYVELVDVFSHDAEPYQDPLDPDADANDASGNTVRPDDLVLYVVALTSYTTLINKSCVGLVHKVLACSWLGRDEKFCRAYVQFLAALVSAQGGYLRAVLEMMIDWFKAPDATAWTVPDFPVVSREVAKKRMHFGLRYLLHLFPASRGIVSKLINQKFPFPAEAKSMHMFYLENLLQLREYAPELGAEVLETITSQLVKIDTEFQLDLSDMDDDLVARVVFQLTAKGSESENDGGAMRADTYANGGDIGDISDDDDDISDAGFVSEAAEAPQPGDPDYDEEVARVDKATQLVQKLDATLDRMFALFAPVFEEPDSEAARTCLEDMLSDFANFVLTVPSSRHTQFLVFHFSQKSSGLQDMFTGTLLNLGFESNRPAAVRLSATAYLSSYVARAARVPRETVRSVASILCHRIEAFRRRHTAACRGPDLRRYQELYAWVQALLYIFCFRWRDLVDAYPEALVDPDDPASFVGHELEWMQGLKASLTNIIHAPFNPLMVCSPPIVAEFAKLAHSLRLMYVFPRIESNKRLQLSQFASGRYMHGDALREDAGYTVGDDKRLQLEGNFPFDPYSLPTSKRWLEGDYVAWTPIPGVGGAGPDDDTDDDNSDSDIDSDVYDEDDDEDDDVDDGADGGDGFEDGM